MYRFALRPRWLASHLLVLVLIAGTVVAGLWQLDRLSERRDRNARVTSRGELPIVDVGDVVVDGAGYEQGGALEFRRVSAAGEYVGGDQVLVRNRTLDGAAGFWVLTPLRTGAAEAVVVNRGWIPFAVGIGAAPANLAPPSGPVTVDGLVRKTVTASGLQNADPAEGVLDEMARPDLARLARQLDYDIAPVYVQLERQQPAVGDIPIPVPAPDLGEGPHLGYAVQWFIFGTIALVGYPLILRKIAKGGE